MSPPPSADIPPLPLSRERGPGGEGLRSLRFATRIQIAFVAALLAAAGIAAAAARWLELPWAVFAATLAFGLPLGWWLLSQVLTPAAQVLQALRDGVAGFRDHDFSLSLAVNRRDELGDLVEHYNRIGDVLREERSNLVQREMLLATVLEATPTAIVLTQRQRVIFVNHAARELFVAEGRLEGKTFDRILEDCPASMCEVLASGRDSLFSVEEEGAGSEVFHLSRRAFELNGVRHDLYLVQRLTQELRRQEVDVWKQAIRTMSHEINNSLARRSPRSPARPATSRRAPSSSSVPPTGSSRCSTSSRSGRSTCATSWRGTPASPGFPSRGSRRSSGAPFSPSCGSSSRSSRKGSRRAVPGASIPPRCSRR